VRRSALVKQWSNTGQILAKYWPNTGRGIEAVSTAANAIRDFTTVV
jgi:hypothetical protein